MPIQYIIGDATRLAGVGNKIIVHCCNDIGAWGAGFVLALSARWQGPESHYRNWKRGIFETPFELGQVQAVRVEKDIWVCNLIGQTGVLSENSVPPIRYEAMRIGLQRVREIAESLSASIHMPRIGCGLAGGSWAAVKIIVERELSDISVTVYDLP